MSLRLHALNLALRAYEKPFLARIKDVELARAGLERSARRVFQAPRGMHVQAGRIAGRHALWTSVGRVDRGRVLLYLHGGAFALGSPETHVKLAAALATAGRMRAVLPHYRRAPEHPFPAAIDDVRDSYADLLKRGYQPRNIAIAGDSAGGGLALSLIHDIGTHGWPQPAALVAFSPWTDLTLSGESLARNVRREALLPVARIAEMRDTYLDGVDPSDPRASPLLATFPTAPPVLIQASRSEVLEADSERMAAVLQSQGHDVRLEFWRRTPHVWQMFYRLLPEANEAIDKAGAFLQSRLDG